MPKVMRYDDWANTNDETFRAWIQVVIDSLTAAGLVRTTDSGQINVATVARPSTTNVMVGYTVWRMNDPLQSVAPVFIKIEFGSGSPLGYPRINVIVGSGSDGAGNITGVTTSIVSAAAMTSTAGAVISAAMSFAVANDWGVAFAGGVTPGATTAGGVGMGFALHRTVDANGAPTADGIMLNASNASGSISTNTVGTVRFLQRIPAESSQTYSGVDIAHLPFSLAGYSVGVSPQIFPTWCALPKVRPMAFLAVAPAASSPNAGQTFQMAVVGATARTYMSIGVCLARHFYTSVSSTPGHSFILWED